MSAEPSFAASSTLGASALEACPWVPGSAIAPTSSDSSVSAATDGQRQRLVAIGVAGGDGGRWRIIGFGGSRKDCRCHVLRTGAATATGALCRQQHYV
jgi:hypothetical protein